MATALQKITTRAKQLKKSHPGTAWVNLVKKASAEYRGGGLGKAKTKARRPAKQKKVRKAAVRGPVTPAAVGGVSTASSVGFHKRQIKTGLEDKLATQVIRAFNATKKSDKRRINKDIAQTKRELRKFR